MSEGRIVATSYVTPDGEVLINVEDLAGDVLDGMRYWTAHFSIQEAAYLCAVIDRAIELHDRDDTFDPLAE